MFAGETSSVHNIHSVDSAYPCLLRLIEGPNCSLRKFRGRDNSRQFRRNTKMTSRQPITADNLQRHLLLLRGDETSDVVTFI